MFIALCLIIVTYFHPSWTTLLFPHCRFPRRTHYKKLTVDIVTLETRLLEMVNLHNTSISGYAKLHNYSYQYFTSYDNRVELPVYWQKLQLVRDILSTTVAEFVMWMDSDTIVAHPTVALEELLMLSPTSSIFIGRDYPNRYWNRLCAGVFMIRNCDAGKKFIDDCISVYTNNPRCLKNGKHALCGPWAGECYEQGVMNKLLQSTYKQHLYVIPRSFLVNSTLTMHSSVIMHVFGPDKRRTAEFFKSKIGRLAENCFS